MTLSNRLWLTPAVSALVFAVGLGSPPPASSLPGADPIADIAANPNPALVNQTVTLDGSGSTGDGDPVLPSTVTDYRWDLDGDGSFETTTGATSSVSQAYPTAATVNVSLQVTDNEGDTAEDTASLKVHNPPTANFIFSPSSPAIGEQITFSSTSSDPDGPITQQWDLNNDGQFNDATGQSVTHAFSSAGNMTVSLQVTDSDGAIASASHAVQVGGSRAPEASFVLAPNSPRARSKVELTSTSSDPDGPIATHDWDLDGDEEFDDATGRVVETRFANKGKRAIGLRVTDGSGATDTETRTIRVRSRRLELMSPFPLVRLSGSVRPTGKTRIDRLTVRGPKGAEVTVRCHGGGCPFDRRRRSVKKTRIGFPGIERLLTPRVALEILVSKPNAIGKFTKFMMRDGKAPKRIDKCLRREQRKPIPCPR